ncbi:MAG TPA: diguanylate cyclase [Jatrophihabitans sp.]|nr:diguanylate cyclase [Jatrophihabitans sp.]
MHAQSHDREEARLAALGSYCVLDTPGEQAFDDIAQLAASLCDTPYALISLVDRDRLWFKARVGMQLCELGRDVSFCTHALNDPGPLLIPDTLLDARFADNPLVRQDPKVRFYAGVPLTTEDGLALGTLCVLDLRPRQLSASQRNQLQILGRQVMDQLTLRRRAQELAESERALTAVATVIHEIQSGADARQTIVDAGAELGHAAFVSLVEHVDGRNLVSASNLPALVGVELPADGSTMTSRVLRTGEPAFITEPSSHPLISNSALQLTGSGSIFFLPVQAAEATFGVLLVAWRESIPNLDDRRVRAVTLLANQAGVALRQSALIAELASLALTDPLTELPNRRNWNQLLQVHLATAERSEQPLAIALADLDHFKRFNDTLGHPAGDALLRAFAAACRQALRSGDLVARWGGEEFAFALPNCSAAEAHAVLDRVRRSVPLMQTCSIGFAVWDGSETAEQLLHRADRALYEVKQNGRNRVSAA